MIKVLIIDDSASIRAVFRAVLESSPQIIVCGEAADAFEARSLIKKLQPDVITLDIEMPKMDGITFLRNLMRLHPIPTIMISTRTELGSVLSIEALSLGAIDCIHKPNFNDIDQIADEIISKVLVAAKTHVLNASSIYDDENPQLEVTGEYIKDRLIAIGASTGGVPAIEQVIARLPTNCPPIIMVQHIPEYFAHTFVKRLDEKYPLNIYLAAEGQTINAGCVYLAPGNHHLEVIKKMGKYHCKLHQAERVCYHRPSVDILFNSVAEITNGNASAALLTGMGKDGAAGLLAMKKKGCFTMIQDEATSLVWGMPKAAAELGAADKVVPLHHTAHTLLNSCYVNGATYAS